MQQDLQVVFTKEVTLGNFDFDFESSSDLGLEKGFAMQHEKFAKF